MKFNPKHYQYMQLALDEAKIAYNKGEVPVGCVIANNKGFLSKAHNQVENLNNPTMHAEIIAINDACKKLGQKYLEEYNIYITLEPCLMCRKAIAMVRLNKVFFATKETKGIVENENQEIFEGIMQEEAKKLLTGFFQNLRAKKV